jgi:hypothetical protein
VQCFIVTAVEMLAERHGGVRALARAMAGKGGGNYEPTVRGWLSLDPSEPRSIIKLNRVVARLSKFSRTEIKKSRRRIHRVAGPAGDRQAIFAHISLLSGYDKPVVPTPEETLVLPLGVAVARVLVGLVCRIAEQLGKQEVYAPWVPASMPRFPTLPPEHQNNP